jgi:hypothetical protein
MTTKKRIAQRKKGASPRVAMSNPDRRFFPHGLRVQRCWRSYFKCADAGCGTDQIKKTQHGEGHGHGDGPRHPGNDVHARRWTKDAVG